MRALPRRIAVALTLLFSISMLPPTASFAAGGIEVALSAPASTVPARSGVWLDVAYTNVSSQPATILKRDTPVNGLEAPLFDVLFQDQPVEYIGKLVKRGPPTSHDYLTLEPGERLSYRVNLAESYSFTETGRYTVDYAMPVGNAKMLRSNEVTLDVVGRSDPAAELPLPGYVGCTTARQSTLSSALTAVSTYATAAQSYFATSRSGPRYTEWFGAMDATRYATVTGHFTKILNAINTATMTFDCTCVEDYYAYVYPSEPYRIYLCNAFWSAPNTGTDSRAGTLIHELSHFTVLGGTDDYAYGQIAARSLARDTPSQAVMNADNHEYFAENTPALANGPVLTLNATDYNFGDITVGATSPYATFTIRNTGDSSLTTGVISTTAPFTVSATCNNKSLAANSTCQFTATFKPVSTGSALAVVTIPNNTLQHTLTTTVSLRGNGVGPGLSLSRTSWPFDEQKVGTTSTGASIRISNTGSSTLTLGAITATTHFAVSTNCNSLRLAVNAYCDLTATFTPTSVGAKTGTISIPSDAPGSPHTVSLTGTGVIPAATLSKTSHNFGEQSVGTFSLTQSFTVTNSGTGTLVIGTPSTTSPFSIDTGCRNASLLPGAWCTINANFRPTSNGPATAAITIPSNGSGAPHSITLNGTGVTVSASATPSSLSFGSQRVGTTSPTQFVTIRNTGTGTVTIGTISAGSGFAVNTACNGAVMTPGSTCVFAASFTPASAGAKSGSITIPNNGSQMTVGVQGQGVEPVVSLSATAHTFGVQRIGTSSSAWTLTITNAGTSDLSLQNLSVSGQFGISGTCNGVRLSPGGTCSLTATFTPTSTGAKNGSISIPSDAAGSPATVALTGTGGSPAIALNTSSYDFGEQASGTTSPAQSFTISNTGNMALIVGTLSASGQFAVTSACNAASIAAGDSCTFSATFRPTGTGSKTGTVTIPSNANGPALTIALSGTGTSPAATVTPASHDFGEVTVGSNSAARTVNVTNTGLGALHLRTVRTEGPFTTDTTCDGAVIAPTAQCELSVRFAPTAPGAATGSVIIDSDAQGAPQTVVLRGVGLSTGPPPVAVVVLSQTAHDFGSVPLGGTSAPFTITVKSSGSLPVTVQAIETTGPFQIDGGTCVNATIPTQQSCAFTVVFRPTTTGIQTGEISIKSNAADSPTRVALIGFGPTPLPQPDKATAVTARAVAGGSKLLVSVYPDLGATIQWKFVIQQRMAGAWKTLRPEHSTAGARHRLRLNLPKGKYRAVVVAPAGYLPSVSKAVKLLG